MAGPSGMHARRMARELQLLSTAPPPGVVAWPRDEASFDQLDAEIIGATDTPYEGGVFRLRVNIPSEYPLKPPSVRFVTKIYHPNIDDQGRICLDTLNMPPKGAWKPSLNIATVLASVQLLMSHPNPDDGLMAEITYEFKRFPNKFHATALEWTRKYATSAQAGATHTDHSVTASPVANVGDGEGHLHHDRSVEFEAKTDIVRPGGANNFNRSGSSTQGSHLSSLVDNRDNVIDERPNSPITEEATVNGSKRPKRLRKRSDNASQGSDVVQNMSAARLESSSMSLQPAVAGRGMSPTKKIHEEDQGPGSARVPESSVVGRGGNSRSDAPQASRAKALIVPESSVEVIDLDDPVVDVDPPTAYEDRPQPLTRLKRRRH